MLFRRKAPLIGALVSLSVALFQSEARAQLKADKGKAEAKDQLKFEIYQDSTKDYRWRLVKGEGNNREVLATGGQGYKAKADCKHGVEVLQTGADKLNFETYEDKGKESRWRAKSSNGQTVAASGSSYKSKAECDKAVETIKKSAAKAPVEEVTEPKS
jgi:uncharacterized protein YegP (UPF0339 family)